MRVAVLGGLGYLGRVLCSTLVTAGHDVRVLDSRTVPPDVAPPAGPRVEVMVGDVRDPVAVRQVVRRADAVVHAAAVVGQPACDRDPGLATAVNVEGTEVVVRSAERDAVLVFLSTSSVYGAQSGHVCDERSVPSPVSLYARTKLSAEAVVLERARSLVLRPATMFGISPQMRDDLLPHQLVRQGLVDGEVTVFQPSSMRSFVHVEDVSALIGAAVVAGGEGVPGRIFNVNFWRNDTTKLELATGVGRLLGVRTRTGTGYSDPDTRDYRVTSAFDQAFSPMPGRSLTAELQRLAAYYDRTLQPRAGRSI